MVPDTEFKIPEDLVEAIEMSSLERMLPKQGNREVIRYLTDTKDKEAAKLAEEWVAVSYTHLTLPTKA